MGTVVVDTQYTCGSGVGSRKPIKFGSRVRDPLLEKSRCLVVDGREMKSLF